LGAVVADLPYLLLVLSVMNDKPFFLLPVTAGSVDLHSNRPRELHEGSPPAKDRSLVGPSPRETEPSLEMEAG
jgi:hypothetical protein